MAPRANVQWKIAFQKRRATVPNPTDVANSTSKPKLPLPLLSKVLQRPKSETIQQESIAEVGDKPYCLSSPLEEYNDYGDVTPHVHCERAYRAVLARLLTTYGLQSVSSNPLGIPYPLRSAYLCVSLIRTYYWCVCLISMILLIELLNKVISSLNV